MLLRQHERLTIAEIVGDTGAVRTGSRSACARRLEVKISMGRHGRRGIDCANRGHGRCRRC